MSYPLSKSHPSCWNCTRLKKSKRVIGENEDHISISAPSLLDALAGYYCDNFWFGNAPDKREMLCGGRDYKPYKKK